MKILAADTATDVITVAVCDGSEILAETVVRRGRAHSERLLATADWALNEAGLTLADLDALAVSRGPGSFTGLRIGMAAWKGLAFAARLPLAAVPTLDAMVWLCPGVDGQVCPWLDARMNEVFAAVYAVKPDGSRVQTMGPIAAPVSEALRGARPGAVFLGDGAWRYRAAIEEAVPGAVFVAQGLGMPRASAVAFEGARLIESGQLADPALAAPVYLRKSQAETLRDRAAPL